MGGIVDTVEPGSLADGLGWRSGDRILTINGHPLSDEIDFRFYSADERLTVVLSRRGRRLTFDIHKDYDTPLGITFRDILFDGVRTCGAHCVFCFVEQLPKGMRRSLYLKDDDFRLSFLHGNFVTLANVSESDLQRIVTQRLSPLYVSVHATDPSLRRKLLGRDAPDILTQIDTLAGGRIALHTQVVLCRDINDGAHLDQTIADLASRYPTVASIAVVPAGLSRHRRNKTPIGAIDAQYSALMLHSIRRWQRRFRKEIGSRLVWPADEFYLSAGEPVPGASVYEGFPQIENGVGLVRRFLDSAARARRDLLPLLSEKTPGEVRPRSSVRSRARGGVRPLRVSLVTGTLAAPLLRDFALSMQNPRVEFEVFEIVNRLLGNTVSVAGLLSGSDIKDQLRTAELGDVVMVPSVALRDEAFIDDVSVDELGQALGTRVEAVEPVPYALVRRIMRSLR